MQDFIVLSFPRRSDPPGLPRIEIPILPCQSCCPECSADDNLWLLYSGPQVEEVKVNPRIVISPGHFRQAEFACSSCGWVGKGRILKEYTSP